MAEPYLICPSAWERTTLYPDPLSGFIAAVESGGTPSTTVEEYWDGDIPWLTPRDITGRDGAIWISSTDRSLTPEGLANSSAKVLPAGTVHLSKRAPVGAVAVSAVPMSTNQGFLNFVCGPKLRPLFLGYWLRANGPYLDLVANGSMYPELYLGNLVEFELAVPSLEEQDRIIAVISALQFAAAIALASEQSVADPAQVIEVQRQAQRLAALRERILPLLLSGVLPTDAVESRLFEHFNFAESGNL